MVNHARFTWKVCSLVFAFVLAGSMLQSTAVHGSAAPDAANTLDWASYGNDLGQMRYVNSDQINPATVAQLQPAWIFHTNVMNKDTSFESQPLIVNGTLYVTSPHDHVFALDAATGALKWTYNPVLGASLEQLHICCGQDNRGVAYGAGTIFLGQLDATLVALDAATGQVLWKVAVDDWHERWTETMAPLYVDGKVIIGSSGGEYEVRGHITAYDANTGKLLWRFYTVPGPGQFGNDTWAGDSWKNGGATVWTTPSVDPQLGMIYFGTGNAGPDLNGSQRAGDNLFTSSIVALDLNTGTYKWHFQEVHHGIWDYDGPMPTILFTLVKDGQTYPAIGHANKNGFYFILDRRTGKPLYDVKEMPVPSMEPAWQHPSATQPVPSIEPLIPQTVDNAPAGKTPAPLFTPPGEQPLVIQPGTTSGPEWCPAAYSPRTKYVYVPAGGYDPFLFHASPQVYNTNGSDFEPKVDGIEEYGLFDALDTTTGKIAWRMKTPGRPN